MDNMKNYESLINDVTDLMYEFERDKIDHSTFIKTLENIVNFEIFLETNGRDLND